MITRHHHSFYPQQTPAMILAGLPWTWSAGLMPLELFWSWKVNEIRSRETWNIPPRCWSVKYSVELHLKGRVARSNHTRRDTIEINVPWCTCNLMSCCQVSHIYAFSCLFPWLLDAWHNISCLKGAAFSASSHLLEWFLVFCSLSRLQVRTFFRFCWVFSWHTACLTIKIKPGTYVSLNYSLDLLGLFMCIYFHGSTSR